MKNDIRTNFDEVTHDEYLNDDVYNINPNWDVWDGWEYEDSLIDNLTNKPSLDISFDYIDGLVVDQDYLWYQNYLDSLSPALVEKVKEYIEFNHPEFMKEDDEIIVDERFSKSDMRPDIAKNFNSRKWSSDHTWISHKKLNNTNTALKDILTW